LYLNCHTFFSLKYGTLSPVELFKEAMRCGVKKLVLTDINNTSGYIDLLCTCRQNEAKYPLSLALGIEFRHQDQLLYLGIARNNAGFEELNRFLSYHNLQDLPLPDQPPEFDQVYLVYPWGSRKPEQLAENEYVGIRPAEINLLYSSPFRQHQEKLVILQPVTFSDSMGFNVHRLLRAIDQNIVLSKLEPWQQASKDEIMVPEPELLKYFWQFPRIIANTKTLLEDCNIEFDLEETKNRKSFTGKKQKDHELLRSQALEGFTRRYEAYDSYTMQRLLKELDVIYERNFEAYFLITLDIIKFARHKNFAYVGRGSGANSMVAYCLGITDVDPIELDLYFERFLNPYRSSPPDFDIDFSWQDRDEVMAYVFDKYTPEYAALLATYNTFQGRSTIRELGKVFGLPKAEIDEIVAYPHQNHKRDHIAKLMFRYAQRLQHMPQHLSIHAGGILITEKPIYAYTATDLPPKGFPITHFDMIGAEDMGLHKYDILSQRGLGHIKDTIAIVKENKGVEIDIKRFGAFKKDPKIKKHLQNGKAMGCFYIESPAMRMLLGKLKCDNYLTLVAASSIIRPGVARSGMMREYIHRHHNPHNFEYIHPKMKELMEESYGVMVYQEDVIKVAHHFAGLDLGEADILRRGMSGKFRSKDAIKQIEDKFYQKCKEKGYPDAITLEVWRQIESFSGYSFSKAHSASYAVESYESLYLKAYFPLEFMVGVINNFGGFYRTEVYFHEARMNGADIQAPCINHSDYLTRIIGDRIYVGLIHLKSLEKKLGELIPLERKNNGPYRNLDDFIKRIPVSLEQITILIRSGAFRFTGRNKKELLWDTCPYFNQAKKKANALELFEEPPGDYKLPPLACKPLEDAYDEMELLGFPLCNPFDMLNTSDLGNTMAAQLMDRVKKRVEMVGYLVTTKNTHTKDRLLMHFGTFLDYEGNVFDTTHFPNVAKQFPFRGIGFYRIRGRVVEDFGYPMVEVDWMDRLPMKQLQQAGKPAPGVK